MTALVLVVAGCASESATPCTDCDSDSAESDLRPCRRTHTCPDAGAATDSGGSTGGDGGGTVTRDAGSSTDSSATTDGAPALPPDAGTPMVGYPNATNTGVPAGTALTAYSGPCVITTANTIIDAKTITCDLDIRAGGVKITRSKVTGSIGVDSGAYPNASFTVSDTTIDVGNRPGTGIGDGNFTALRVHVYGGNRSINCAARCTVQDSYVHGQFTDLTGVYHESGIRMGQYSTIRHNTILCDAPNIPPDAGCSADLTGYGDFSPVDHNLIEKNLFRATTGGACAYGGSSQGKPYSNAANNIQFLGNVFERGKVPSDKGTFVCGYYFAITDFDENAPGNAWLNNSFDDGTPL